MVWKELKVSDLSQPFSVSSLSASVSILEVGRSINSISFSYSSNEDIVSATINDSQYNVSTVVPNTSPFVYQKTFSRLTQGSVSFTLTCKNSDGEALSTSTSISWLFKRYYGVAAAYISTNPLEDFVKSLTKSELASNKNFSYTVNCGADQKIYLAVPVSFGTPAFYVGGFAGGFHLLGNVDIINQYDVTNQYQVWESDNFNLGNTTVSVQ